MRGQGRVYKRMNSNYWWISYCSRGKEYRESSRSPDRKQAERLLKHSLGFPRITARTISSRRMAFESTTVET